jgi:FkbM family methyltransferase
MSSQFYSQLGQDKTILDFYAGKKGYFVDVGAFDGIQDSNTYTLELQGWKGICIEPNPQVFESLKNNRRAVCVNTAAFDKSGLEFEFSIAREPVLSGISQFLGRHKNYVENTLDRTVIVKTETLNDVFTRESAPLFIHYLSVDTEGTEDKVLQGIDWNKYQFGYVTIEHNFEEPRRSEIRNFMREKGYFYRRENSVDDDYIFCNPK